MEKVIENHINGMAVGKAQNFGNMTVFPLTFPVDCGQDYVTLGEALEAGVFTVREVSEGGSVPKLWAVNKGSKDVLLLDGEELAGAKQNRVLNTTILVAAGTELEVPVSCTEQGRWRYISEKFFESGIVMERSMRAAHMRDIHSNLSKRGEYHSDQNQVWNRITMMGKHAEVRSATKAMRDVFEAKRDIIEDYLRNFKAIDGQKGLLVFLSGKAVGFDFISKPAAFVRLFPKLIKSYAMEAVLEVEQEKRKAGAQNDKSKGTVSGGEASESKRKNHASDRTGKDEKNRMIEPEIQPLAEQAKAFLAEAAACSGQKHPSVGLGTYYRFSGDAIVGSCLTVNDSVIHMAFFKVEKKNCAGRKDANQGNIIGMSHRRGYRLI